MVESLAPGVNISAVARSHGLNPQQLFGWRKRFRREASGLIAPPDNTPTFAPAIVEPALMSTTPATPQQYPVEGSIEVSVGGATVRIRGAVDAKTLAVVLKTLKVLA